MRLNVFSDSISSFYVLHDPSNEMHKYSVEN